MKYLIDTNVLSEVRKGPRCNDAVAAWWSGIADDEMFLSVLTIGEIRKGIEKARGRDVPFALALEAWLLRVLKSYRDRILVIDLEVVEEWGRLNVPDPLPIIDGLITATAKVHSLTLVTRNTSDFVRTGVHSLNPFAT